MQRGKFEGCLVIFRGRARARPRTFEGQMLLHHLRAEELNSSPVKLKREWGKHESDLLQSSLPTKEISGGRGLASLVLLLVMVIVLVMAWQVY